MHERPGMRPKVAVCVLGDLGHSPRMLYHVHSLVRLGYQVELCGYLESSLPEHVVHNDQVTINDIKPITNSKELPYVFFIVYKLVLQLFSLTGLLSSVMRGSEFILIQNPPCIPLLLIIVVLQRLCFRGCKLVIDWHNLNFTILNMKFNNLRHPMVRFLKQYERVLSHYAFINITVSQSLAKFLVSEFGVPEESTVVVYDRSGDQFKPLENMGATRQAIIEAHPECFADYRDGDRIIVTSTSFTEDEDFGLFTEALQLYDARARARLHVVVTGKGPLREQFLSSLAAAKLTKVSVKSVWLPIGEYPKILAIADLGVSLHVSSSGLDLPMKVVDLFGCGTPVIALGFSTISELVQDKVNGEIVYTAPEMASTLERLLSPNSTELATLKGGAMDQSRLKWDTEWDAKLKPRFSKDTPIS